MIMSHMFLYTYNGYVWHVTPGHVSVYTCTHSADTAVVSLQCESCNAGWGWIGRGRFWGRRRGQEWRRGLRRGPPCCTAARGRSTARCGRRGARAGPSPARMSARTSHSWTACPQCAPFSCDPATYSKKNTSKVNISFPKCMAPLLNGTNRYWRLEK